MGRSRDDTLVLKLAHAVAGGSTVAKAASAIGVKPRTARNWARRPEFITTVARIRQRATDRIVGKLTRHALAAVDAIAKLVKSGENHSVQLNAAKTICGLLIEVENHAMTTRAMNDVATRLEHLERSTNAQSPDTDKRKAWPT